MRGVTHQTEYKGVAIEIKGHLLGSQRRFIFKVKDDTLEIDVLADVDLDTFLDTLDLVELEEQIVKELIGR